MNVRVATPEARQSFRYLGYTLLTYGKKVDTGHWQAVKDVPHTKTIELTNVHASFESMPSTVEGLQAYFEPNLPWAEDHFQERVSGEPLNPGEQYKNWPWYTGGVEGHRKCQTCGVPVEDHDRYNSHPFNSGEAQFSHTYMERFWPRYARGYYSDIPVEYRTDRLGIRYRYGDLIDLVDLLAREPYTRQAYLPVWFPEDTGAHHGERVPCTLGYHFMLREGKLNIFYPMRSCDFLRYMRDDCYLAARLGLWIMDQVREKTMGDISGPEEPFDKATLGHLNFFAASLHVFGGDLPKMRREYA